MTRGANNGNCICDHQGGRVHETGRERYRRGLRLRISSITRAFYKQIEREHRIPLTLEYPKPNKESLESIREADEIARNGGPTYASAKEMFEAMGV